MMLDSQLSNQNWYSEYNKLIIKCNAINRGYVLRFLALESSKQKNKVKSKNTTKQQQKTQPN